MTPLRRLPLAHLGRTVALGCTAIAATGVAVTSPAGAASSRSVDARERAVLERVNAVRAEHGVRPLQLSERLSRSADRHTRRMSHRRTLGHQLPGEAPLASRLRWAIGSAQSAEVVAWRQRSARSSQLVRIWMDSPGHRAVLLSSQFRTAGIGIVNGRGGVYATIDLAAR